MESRGISLLGSYVGHKMYERNRPNSSGSVSKVGITPLVAAVVANKIDGDGDSDH